MIVISPHLDDAVFSCGRLLAARPGCTVVTVFAGTPPDPSCRTPWDTRSGFTSAAQALTARREEDREALALLRARPVWLEFTDSQYGASPPVHELSAALRGVIEAVGNETVLLPLGLFHSDHLLAHEAAMSALRTLRHGECFAYEDALYRGLRGLLQQRLAALAGAGVTATPARLRGADDARLKQRAVQTYASQLRALGPGGVDDTAWPERYWRLEQEGDSHAT